jgi:hypothetical protein
MTQTEQRYVVVVNEGSARFGQIGKVTGSWGPAGEMVRLAEDGEVRVFMLGELRDASPAEEHFAKRVFRVTGFLGYPSELAYGAILSEVERNAYAENDARNARAARR